MDTDNHKQIEMSNKVKRIANHMTQTVWSRVMRFYNRVIFIKILFLVWLPILCPLGIAASAMADKLSLPDKPVAAYRLTLSLDNGARQLPSLAPSITLKLTNLTRNTLGYAWEPVIDANYASFHVEYKTPTDDPNVETGWDLVKPTVKPIAKLEAVNSNPVVSMITNRQKILVLPRESSVQSFVPDFLMTKPGFYRVTAVMTIPYASEFSGKISEPTLVKNFTLVAFSKPIVIRRTSADFAEVPVATGKATPAH